MRRATLPRLKILGNTGWQMDRAQRFMALGVAFSVLAHAIPIFGMKFVMPDPKTLFSAQPLEVVLVNQRTLQDAHKADALAQANLNGGGNTDVLNQHVKSPLPASENPQSREVERAKAQQKKLEADAEKLLLQLKADTRIAQDLGKSTHSEHTGLDNEQLKQQAREIAGLAAQISKQTREYQSRPRMTFIGARAREYRFARYVENWRMKMERVGALAYPLNARGQKLYGRLMVSVEIDANGNVRKTEITKSSGNKELDSAALRIVKMAAPFGKFPDDIRKDTDVISISRTWTFAKGDAVLGQD
ncbi:energy transducer TonB [Iodobacter ciconiae]|uniref:Energy transducer TonB n=2 Tax=Iodobacter ciconiae TaxID=2496266 RepID=A0A3S8ZVB7_9NEIS|nr:energy transducer TonB [Iodobacter ciconiae]